MHMHVCHLWADKLVGASAVGEPGIVISLAEV